MPFSKPTWISSLTFLFNSKIPNHTVKRCLYMTIEEDHFYLATFFQVQSGACSIPMQFGQQYIFFLMYSDWVVQHISERTWTKNNEPANSRPGLRFKLENQISEAAIKLAGEDYQSYSDIIIIYCYWIMSYDSHRSRCAQDCGTCAKGELLNFVLGAAARGF